MTRKRKPYISPAIARLQERRERLAHPVIQQIVAIPQPPHSTATRRGKPVVEGQAALF